METEMSDAHISDRLRLDTLADVKAFVDLVIQAIFFRHNADKIGHVGETLGGDALPLEDRFEVYREAPRLHHGEAFVDIVEANHDTADARRTRVGDHGRQLRKPERERHAPETRWRGTASSAARTDRQAGWTDRRG